MRHGLGRLPFFRCVLNVWVYAQNCDDVIVILVAHARGVSHLEKFGEWNSKISCAGKTFSLFCTSRCIPVRGRFEAGAAFFCLCLRGYVHCCARGAPLVLA